MSVLHCHSMAMATDIIFSIFYNLTSITFST